MWRIDDPQGSESLKVKYDIVPYTRGKGLDVGCGGVKAFPHFIGVDNMHHAQEFGWDYKPDVVIDDAIDLGVFASQSMDFVFSSHLLEHMEKPEKALREWWRTLKQGGYLVLYLPDDSLYPKCGTEGANPDHKQNLDREKVIQWMKEVGSWDLVVNELRDHDNGADEYGNEYSFYQVYKKQSPVKKARNRIAGKQQSRYTYSYRDVKTHEKYVCVVRYGGFGDMIQASTLFPYYKQEGYHVTVMTTPRGQDLLKADPNVDDFIIQDTDQVPNNELHAYWQVWKEKFDVFINLSESVEGSLLSIPGRTMYDWPVEARQFILDINYLDLTHKLGHVPLGTYNARFYPTEDELDWARQMSQTINPAKRPVIVWSLAGSSVHKAWPWLDRVVARLMLETNCIVVMVGDEYCQMLEAGWEKEERVIRASGIWAIRDSLTFAQNQADLVIGTETGLLNAVGLERVNKIITLSHSSEENLTKHWLSTQALMPDPAKVPCFPCHLMHYGFTYCHRDQNSGCALCQVEITPDQMWEAILNWYDNRIVKAS